MRKLQRAVNSIEELDERAMRMARERQERLTKPSGSLGVLEDLSVKLAGITGNARPEVGRKVVIVMAGDHGVTIEGVSAFPSEVTPQMVLNFASGGAAINVLARHVGADVVVVDIGVAVDVEAPGAAQFANPRPGSRGSAADVGAVGLVHRKVRRGTDNMAIGPAMSREEAIACVEVGIEMAHREVERGATLLATGDMGIGNTTPSSAILAALTGSPVADVVGRGTGIEEGALAKKREVVERALRVNAPNPEDPIDVLSKVGGLEIGGLAGVIIGSAARRVPVVIDGFISGAAALLAAKIAPQSIDYMIASHVSAEPGHRKMLEHLGLKPMLHMDMRLGEGTGAALAMGLVEAAAKVLNEMATFAEAGVSEKKGAPTRIESPTKN